MLKLREIAKKMPVVPSLYRMVRDKHLCYRGKSKSSEDVFTDIFRKNAWGGKESFSGTGSDSYQTKIIIE